MATNRTKAVFIVNVGRGGGTVEIWTDVAVRVTLLSDLYCLGMVDKVTLKIQNAWFGKRNVKHPWFKNVALCLGEVIVTYHLSIRYILLRSFLWISNILFGEMHFNLSFARLPPFLPFSIGSEIDANSSIVILKRNFKAHYRLNAYRNRTY